MVYLSKDVSNGQMLPKLYEPSKIEPKWQKYWQQPNVYDLVYKFHKYADKPVFVIDTPPPFTSGELHMGHAYWNMINDSVARYKRMRGYNVILPQGWDCQGLPTELKVQYKLGISRDNEELFIQKCREWTESMIISMKRTMIMLGYRPDWEQFEYRTMDPEYHKNVQLSLLDFYRNGLIYRGEFPVYWCTKCETALAQAEIGYEEKKGVLYYIKFPCGNGYLEVATTRPELLSACQALLVHPEDERYTNLIGKTAKVPIFENEVRIIADKEVDPKFGTGMVMVCTFGDEQDIKWQQRYNLPIKKVINELGYMMNSSRYTGFSTSDARKRIVSDLGDANLLSKKENIVHGVLCHTERSDCVSPIEFLVKKQWFIKIKPLKEKMIALSKDMRWIPPYMNQRLIDWINSIEWDWLISRQRLFGTPLPFWYCENCGQIFPSNEKQLPVDPKKAEPPIKKCSKCGSAEIKPEKDVCDCWVDSSITPLIISGFFDDKRHFASTYPANVREQGHDIIRTWLFYTIFRCTALTGKAPFKEVLINGHILGPDGYKMSKSKGNVVDPKEKLGEYGSDALRLALLSLTIGSDFPFKWESAQFEKGFLQKYWSASRFAQTFLNGYTTSIEDEKQLRTIDLWIITKFVKVTKEATQAFDDYRFDDGIKLIVNYFWHDFCDQYLEAIKYRLYSEENEVDKKAVKYTLFTILWNTTLILAPLCPHITEEIYNILFSNLIKTASVHALNWPSIDVIPFDENEERKGENLVKIIAQIRLKKSSARKPLAATIDKLTIKALGDITEIVKEFEEDIKQILHIKTIVCEKSDIFELSFD